MLHSVYEEGNTILKKLINFDLNDTRYNLCKNKIKNPPEKMGLKILKRILINL